MTGFGTGSLKLPKPILPVAWSSLAVKHREYDDRVAGYQIIDLDIETPYQLPTDAQLGRCIRDGCTHPGKLQRQCAHSIDFADKRFAEAGAYTLVIGDRVFLLLECFAEKPMALHVFELRAAEQ